MNLVVGATGVLGYEICRKLSVFKTPVRALVRNPFDQLKAQKMKELGIQLVQGDLRNPKSFGPALNGISTIIATASAMPSRYIPGENDIKEVDQNGMMDLLDAAAKAGVHHFIYISFSGQISHDFPLRNAKRTVEQHLRKSGMVYTILRPSFFTEAWLTVQMGFDIEAGRVRIFGTGTQAVSYISLYDVAHFAVASIINPIAHNAILELGGPEKLSQLDVVQIFEQVHGRKFELDNVTEEDLRVRLNTATNAMEKSLAGLMLCLAKGDSIEMKNMLKAFHINLRPVRDYAEMRVPAH